MLTLIFNALVCLGLITMLANDGFFMHWAERFIAQALVVANGLAVVGGVLGLLTGA